MKPQLDLFPDGPKEPAAISAKERHEQTFQLFWDAWPAGYKAGKGNALKSWLKLKPSQSLIQTILLAIEQQKKSERWHEGTIPNPATWLNQGRWDDELKPAAAGDRAIRSKDKRSVY